MYRNTKYTRSSIHHNTSKEGETIEKKVFRMKNNKEPFTAEVGVVYTERKEGVLPQYNIRTDRFEIAIEAMDAVDKTHKAKREARHNPPKEEGKKEGQDGGAESSQATS